MTVKILPPVKLIRQLLDYDAATGNLTWLERSWLGAASWNARYAGKRAFTARNKKGYYIGQLNATPYLAHRLIWKHVTGEEPNVIDHIDGNPANNRFENLRSVDVATNSKNRKLRNDCPHEVSGIQYTNTPNRPWKASIGVNRVNIYIGAFKTKEEAIAARLQAEKLHGFIQR